MQEHGPDRPFYFGQNERQRVDSLDFLTPLLTVADPLEKVKILKGFRDLSSTNNGEKSRRAFAALFSSSNSRRFKTELDRLRINQEDLGQFFDLPPVTSLAAVMLSDPNKYLYQLGILLPLLDKIKDKLPQDWQTFKKDPTQLKVIPTYRDWSLCPSSEERLVNAIQDQAIVVVNDFLAFKFEGKMCGLAVENTVTVVGHTFIKGNFYAPTDFEERNLLKKAFLKGKAKMNLTSGKWVILRSAANTQEITRNKLLSLAQNYVSNPPESLPKYIAGYSHRRYLEKMIEHFTS